jgi:hypothetical protein
MLKHPLRDTAFGPTAEPQVDLYPVVEPLRQIAPWRPGTIAVQHRLHEQPIVRRDHTDRAFAFGQLVRDSVPLVVAQSEPPHHQPASYKLAPMNRRMRRAGIGCAALGAD